jgi:hypothetical protein
MIMCSIGRSSYIAAILIAALMTTPASSRATQLPTSITAEKAREIAIEAYVYAYPLVISELTRRVSVSAPGGAQMNQFTHKPMFPDASFTDVVRPNADTLYSILWFDVSKEPLAITVPDSGGRYYMLPMIDLWSDVFAVPGSQTTGNKA